MDSPPNVNEPADEIPDMGSSDEEGVIEEEVDPRVQGELETLNCASDEINTLERELDRSRNKFRSLLTESTQRLNTLFKKLGKCVLKARPYYDLVKNSKQSQADAQKAAVNFQRSNSVYRAAKEMVQLAEERNFPEDGDRRQFDSAWQEMLNHATIKFMESEKEKADSEEVHLLKAAEYAAIQQKVRFYERDMPRNISKAKTYFDLKDKLEKQLQLERMNVEDLQMGLVCAKHKYRSALKNLEAISEEIHQKRKKRLKLPPRTPGVGAESTNDSISLPSVNLDNLSDIASLVSLEDLEADGASLQEEMLQEYTKIDGDSSQNANVTEKIKGLTVSSSSGGDREEGVREAVAEGSESSVSSNHQEVSPTQLLGTNMKSVNTPNTGSVLGSNFSRGPTSQAPQTSNKIGAGQMVATAVEHKDSSKSSPSRKAQKKLQTQMAFPILQGLFQSQKGASRQMAAANANSRGHYQSSHHGYPLSRQATPGGRAVAEKDPSTTNSTTGAEKKKEEVFV